MNTVDTINDVRFHWEDALYTWPIVDLSFALYQPPEVGPGQRTVAWAFSFSPLPYSRASFEDSAVWPPSPFSPPPLTLEENIFFPVNELLGPVHFEAVPYDTPIGPIP